MIQECFLSLSQSPDDGLFRHKVFEIERFKVGNIFIFPIRQQVLGDCSHAFRGDGERVIVAGVRMSSQDGTCLGGPVAEEYHLMCVKQSVVDARLDDVGSNRLHLNGKWRYGKVRSLIAGSVAFHAACVNHGADKSPIVRMAEIIEGRHRLERGHRKQRYLQGIAEPFGTTDTNTQTSVAARTAGHAHPLQLLRGEGCLPQQFFDEDRQA